MPDIDEIFEDETNEDDAIIQKYPKVIVLRDLTWWERFKIWLMGLKLNKL